MNRLMPAIFFVILAAAFSGCGGGDDGGPEPNPFGLEEQVVAAADNPAALAFAPDGRLFFAEKYTGNIRLVDAAGTLQEEPFAHVDVINWLNLEWGLTGLALHPDFATNGYVYALYTQLTDTGPDGGTPDSGRPIGRPVLVRFTDENGRGVDETVLIDDFPETRLDHQGFKTNGDIQFGPDGALYLSMGDYDWGKDGPNGTGAALDLSFPGGKILRLDEQGQPVPDNPLADNPDADPRVFAYGFRQGGPLTVHPQTGAIYTTDATDSCEELDVVQAGADYGWPDVGEFPFSDCYAGAQQRAVHLFAMEGREPGQFQSVTGVSGLAFLAGTKYTTLGDGLLACSAIDGVMRRLVFTAEQVTASDVVVRDCGLDVAVSPDGTIYYSNKTEVRRLLPPQTQAASP